MVAPPILHPIWVSRLNATTVHWCATCEICQPSDCGGQWRGCRAGANIALACDIVIAARSASFIQAFKKIGLDADLGGSFFPPALGNARAMGWHCWRTSYPPSRPRWGLDLATVQTMLILLPRWQYRPPVGRGPTLAYARIKQAMHAAERNTLDSSLNWSVLFSANLATAPIMAQVWRPSWPSAYRNLWGNEMALTARIVSA
jgi:hypothetical protein